MVSVWNSAKQVELRDVFVTWKTLKIDVKQKESYLKEIRLNI